jgi:hypothetical protein
VWLSPDTQQQEPSLEIVYASEAASFLPQYLAQHIEGSSVIALGCNRATVDPNPNVGERREEEEEEEEEEGLYLRSRVTSLMSPLHSVPLLDATVSVYVLNLWSTPRHESAHAHGVVAEIRRLLKSGGKRSRKSILKCR